MNSSASRVGILVVDDEAGAREPLCEFLEDEGFDARGAEDGEAALRACEGWTPDIVLTDLQMPNLDGLGLIRRLRADELGCGIVVMTAFGSIETAVEALRCGADDYLVKPIHLGQLLVMMHRIVRKRALQAELRAIEAMRRESEDSVHASMTENSISMKSLRQSLEALAHTEAHVLVFGEIGAGKGAVARRLHEITPGEGRLHTLNCSVPSDKLVQQLLFGDEADGEHGWVARGGDTVILTDVEHLSAAMQERLDQVLQSPGHNRGARLVSTTCVDLHEEVESGRFLASLYAKLSVARVRVPTLRERREDIVAIVSHTLEEAVARHDRDGLRLSPDALESLVEFPWPGNLRQLRQVIERAVLLAEGDEVTPRELPDGLTTIGDELELPAVPGSSLRDLERYTLLRTLESVGGSTTKAAAVLGISPRKIQYRLNEYKAEEVSAREASLRSNSEG